MRILAFLVAFVLITGDQPKPSRTSPPPMSEVETWHLTIPDAIKVGLNSPMPIDRIVIGAVEIPLGGFEPTPMPKIPKPRVSDNPEPDTEWPLTLTDAIWLGLGNAEFLRVKPTADDSGIAIEPVDPDRSLWAFQAEVMTLVRSIEREYGSLRQQCAAFQPRAAAVKEAEAILQEARNNLDGTRGPVTPIDEIERALEGFQLELVSATSDVITTERQLRNLLGLAPGDSQRIVPDTPATEVRVAPDWAASVRAMNESHPAIVEQTTITRLYELQLIMSRNQILPPMGLDSVARFRGMGSRLDQEWTLLVPLIVWNEARGHRPSPNPTEPLESQFIGWQKNPVTRLPFSVGRSPLPNVRQGQYQLIRQRGTLQGIIRLATESLSRTFCEVETTHDQFEADRRASLLAHERAEAQRGFYREGRIDAGRMLEAIAQEANAAVAEALSLASDNASLVAFEEAKGTLLEFDGIHLDGISKVDPGIKALASIPTALSDGSHGLRLIEEGLPRSLESIGYPTLFR